MPVSVGTHLTGLARHKWTYIMRKIRTDTGLQQYLADNQQVSTAYVNMYSALGTVLQSRGSDTSAAEAQSTSPVHSLGSPALNTENVGRIPYNVWSGQPVPGGVMTVGGAGRQEAKDIRDRARELRWAYRVVILGWNVIQDATDSLSSGNQGGRMGASTTKSDAYA